MAKSKRYQWIPTSLTLAQFDQFILPHIIIGSRGPAPTLPLHAIFNYVLRLLYTGCQWKELPISRDQNGRPEIHCVFHADSATDSTAIRPPLVRERRKVI